MEILDKIFGSAAKVRMMRLFLLNPTSQFSIEEIMERTMTEEKEVRKEIAVLEKIALIKKKSIHRKDEKTETSRKVQAWSMRSGFVYLKELQDFLVNANVMKYSVLVKKLSRAGKKIRLIVVAGIFLNQFDGSGVDLLIVGDEIKKSALEHVIRKLESEIGKELHYALFDTADFKYRVNMCDKLVRDILDYPHQTVLDRIGVE